MLAAAHGRLFMVNCFSFVLDILIICMYVCMHAVVGTVTLLTI